MPSQSFDFLRYGKAIERMITEWRKYTQEVLQQSTDLGSVREHFVKHVLENFLPQNITVGSGEIIDGVGNRSGQEDIILYRSDFPVITSLTPVNAYLAEGVIATIEVKSNLSKGNDLLKAFRNSQKVLLLNKRAYIVSGHPEQIEKLKTITSIKTYVVGYIGWKTIPAILNQYNKAGKSVDWAIPNLICQPGACILRNDGFIGPDPSVENRSILLHRENPYAVFLHHLLKTIMLNSSGSIVTARGIDAVMTYDLDPYFNFSKPLEFERYPFQFTDGS
jgi:hypothetical protein